MALINWLQSVLGNISCYYCEYSSNHNTNTLLSLISFHYTFDSCKRAFFDSDLLPDHKLFYSSRFK